MASQGPGPLQLAQAGWTGREPSVASESQGGASESAPFPRGHLRDGPAQGAAAWLLPRPRGRSQAGPGLSSREVAEC